MKGVLRSAFNNRASDHAMSQPVIRLVSRAARTALGLGALSLAAIGHAGRPLSVEDAGVNPARQCQLESWVDNSNNESSMALAPACGLGYGFELGVEFNNPYHTSRKDSERGVGLKWVPENGEWLGWQLGAKLSTSQTKAAGSNTWESGATSLLGIATYPINPAWTVHLNMGVDFEKHPSDQRATAGAAAVWTPHKNWLVFAELSGARNTAATRAAGTRFWLMPDELGLDFTVSRTNGNQDPTAYTLGVSWYGVKF